MPRRKTQIKSNSRKNHGNHKKHSKQYEEELKCKARKNSMKDGAYFSIMEGAGSSYTTPYLLALGGNSAQVGFLSSGPQLIGTLFQLLSIRSMARFRRKSIVLFGAAMQALMWMPLIIIGAMYFNGLIGQSIAILLTIAVYMMITIFGAIISPAWNSWTKDILPKKAGNYFGHRAKLTGIMSLISMLIAGIILDHYEKIEIFFGFLLIFTTAFLARAISASYLSRQYEPRYIQEKEAYFSIFEFIEKMLTNNFGRYVFFIAAFNFAVAIASPFFSVFMLKDLKFSYLTYTIVSIMTPLVMIVFYPFWGKFQDRYGNLRVLKITGFFIPFVPLFWFLFPFFFRDNIYLLFGVMFFVEVMSGIAWSGFNLSMVNFIYDAVTRQRLAICVSYFHILNAFGAFLGAMMGGYLAKLPSVMGMNSFYFVFILSASTRMLMYYFLIPRIHEVRKVKDFGFKEAKRGLHHIRPETLIRKFR